MEMSSGFSPKARWDRNIPQTDYNTNTDALDERIEVLSWFRNAKIYPHTFIWNKKQYEIKKVNYAWQEKSGKETITYFSVTTELDTCQISFNNTTFGWRINKILH